MPFRCEPRQPITPNRPAAVYFVHDATGLIVYIGVAFDPLVRIRFHLNTAAWAAEIDTWSADWYSTRQDAERVEATLIETHEPIYNVRGTALHREVSLRYRIPTYQRDMTTYAQPIPPGRRPPRHGLRTPHLAEGRSAGGQGGPGGGKVTT
jgi:hypothetical protein